MSLRLARLRSVRSVELRVALFALVGAQRGVTHANAMAARVERLIADLPDGPSRQAVAATRAALNGAALRLAERRIAANADACAAGKNAARCKQRCDVVDAVLVAARRTAS